MYVTGVPLSIFEHPLWIETFRLLRPSYSPPTRKVLSTTLLDKEFDNVKEKVNENIRVAQDVHLCVDGWSNMRNEGILNFVIHTPKPNFYCFVETKTNRHTAEYLFSESCKVLEAVGPQKFLAVVSDNAANMIKCGKMVETKYKNIVWIGCLAHTLHLLINDILKLESVSQCFDKTIQIIKTIRHSQVLTATFKQVGLEKGIQISLHLPVKTRWGSYLQSLESLYSTKIVVQTLAINEEHIQSFGKNLKQVILDDDLWCEIDDLKRFLDPIVKWITVLEGDYCGIHGVYKAFAELTKHFEKSCNIFFPDESQNIQDKFRERKQHALKGVHLAAFMLDPKVEGEERDTLLPSEVIEACETIYDVARNMEGISEDIVLKELSSFRAKEDLWSKPFLWKSSNIIEPNTWWKTFFYNTELGKVAVRILTIPATSASVERSFSTFSNVHTKKRHRLNATRAGKLCYIAHNWKVMNKQATGNVGEQTPPAIESGPNILLSSSSSLRRGKVNVIHHRVQLSTMINCFYRML